MEQYNWTSYATRLKLNNSLTSYKPNNDELTSADARIMHTFPHLTPWKHMNTICNDSIRVRTCSHPLCPASLIMDIVLTSQIPKKVDKMDSLDKSTPQSLPAPIIRLDMVSQEEFNITPTWVQETSDVKIQCGLESMAIKVPNHVQQVQPLDPTTSIFTLRTFSYSKEGLYECIRLNMTKGRRALLRVSDCRHLDCPKNEICYAIDKGTVTHHACLKTVKNKLFKQSNASIFFIPLWAILILLGVASTVHVGLKRQRRKEKSSSKTSSRKRKSKTGKPKRDNRTSPSETESQVTTSHDEKTPLLS